jgi:hypothetical protein
MIAGPDRMVMLWWKSHNNWVCGAAFADWILWILVCNGTGLGQTWKYAISVLGLKSDLVRVRNRREVITPSAFHLLAMASWNPA